MNYLVLLRMQTQLMVLLLLLLLLPLPLRLLPLIVLLPQHRLTRGDAVDASEHVVDVVFGRLLQVGHHPLRLLAAAEAPREYKERQKGSSTTGVGQQHERHGLNAVGCGLGA